MCVCVFVCVWEQVGRKSENGKLKPMFVQFILDQVWAVHKAVLLEPDQDQARKIVAALKLKVWLTPNPEPQTSKPWTLNP